MSNFGFTDLRLVNPYDVAFQEARSAVRSKYILDSAKVCATVAEAVADCQLVVGSTALGHRDLRVPLYPLEAAAAQIRPQLQAAQSVALLFGSEKFGLSNDDMSHCHWLLRIPTRDEHGSMNLGQAVSICLYELRRSEERASLQFAPATEAAADEVERFTESLIAILAESGYVNQRTAESTELKVRRLVRRLGLRSGDMETWFGILRQIGWKVRGGADTQSK